MEVKAGNQVLIEQHFRTCEDSHVIKRCVMNEGMSLTIIQSLVNIKDLTLRIYQF